MSLRPSVFGVLALFLWAQSNSAQGTTASLSGTIKDSQGALLSGAVVEVLNEDKGLSRTVASDAAGRYWVAGLIPGRYRVRASQNGFQTVERTGINLAAGRDAVLNFDLPQGINTQVIVQPGGLLQTDSLQAAVGSHVDGALLRALPLAVRGYEELVSVQPSVIQYGAGAGSSFAYSAGSRFSSVGGRGYTNSFLLDGTDISDHAHGTPGNTVGRNPGVEAISEFAVLTNAYSAEYGRGSGAIVSTITRSGTNQFHGSLFAFHTNSALSAQDYVTNTFGLPDPVYRLHQFGATVGGPIRREKTFFFGNYEGWRAGLAVIRVSSVPDRNAKQGFLPAPFGGLQRVPVSEAVQPFLALYPDPNGRLFFDGTGDFVADSTVASNGDYFLIRGDHQLGANTSLFGRYTFDDDSREIPQRLPVFKEVESARRQYSTIQLSRSFGAALFNSTRLAYNRSVQEIDSVPTVSMGPEVSFVPGHPMGSLSVSGLTRLGSTDTNPRWWVFNLFEVADDLSLATGSHRMKFGAAASRLHDNVAENFLTRGQYTFRSLPDFLVGRPSSFAVVAPGKDPYRGFRQSVFAAYAQDDWRLASRLTLNLGLRWEAATNPSEAHGRLSNIQSPLDPVVSTVDKYFQVTKKNFGPRAGIAWQLLPSGRLVLRAGGGIYHDQLLPFLYARFASKLPPFFEVLQLPQVGLTFPNAYQQVVTLPTSSGLVNLDTINWENQTPTKYHYNVNVQQQLWGGTVIEVAYLGSAARHLWRRAERNTPIPTLLGDGRKSFSTTALRRNPNFASIQVIETDANSSYHALRVTARRASSSGLQFQASYTFSKSLDDVTSFASGDTVNEPPSTLDPDDRRRDRGLSAFHAKNHVAFYASYPLPFRYERKLVELLLGGWKFNAVGTFNSGRPFTALLGFNNSRNRDPNAPDRPDLVPGSSNNPVIGSPDRWFDAASFQIPQPGTYGTLGRNTLIGPGLATLDVSVEKAFAIRENLNLQFRAESFNVTNHANFGLPETDVFTLNGFRNGLAGRITSVITPGRQIRFGVKANF